MESVEIPISSDKPYFSQETLLFGKTFVFEFEWLEWSDCWFLHIRDAADNIIYSGIRLITNWPLLYVSEQFPIQLFLLDSSKNSKEKANIFFLEECSLVAELHPEVFNAF